MSQCCELPAWEEGRFEYWSFEAPLAICWALLTSQIDVSLNTVSYWITWGNQLLTLDVCAVQPLENALFLFLSPSVCLFVSLLNTHMHTCKHKDICLSFLLGNIVLIFCETISCQSTLILLYYICTLQHVGYGVYSEAKLFLLI